MELHVFHIPIPPPNHKTLLTSINNPKNFCCMEHLLGNSDLDKMYTQASLVAHW